MMTNNNTQLINDFVLRVQPRVIDEKYSIFSFGQISSLYSKKVNQRVEAGIGYAKPFPPAPCFRAPPGVPGPPIYPASPAPPPPPPNA